MSTATRVGRRKAGPHAYSLRRIPFSLIVKYILLVLYSVFALLPLVWMISAAFKPGEPDTLYASLTDFWDWECSSAIFTIDVNTRVATPYIDPAIDFADMVWVCE